MKKLLTLAVLLALTAGAFAQDNRNNDPRTLTSQSLALTGPGNWTPGTQITLDVNLTFAGYTAVGYSYWLQLPTALAPFVHVATTGSVQYFTFTDGNQSSTAGTDFNVGAAGGASPGNMLLARDLGATSDPDPVAPAGTYHISTITFTLDAGASSLIGQSFTMSSTSLSPRISEVSDTNFNDNNIIPPGTFMITIVPEPSTLALLGLAAVGSGLVVYRRKASR